MRKVAIGPIVAILIAALPSAIAATGVDGSYTCSSTSACFSASQSGPSGSSGAGFHGSAVNGPGMRGNSTNETGILGQSAAGSLYSPGVEGESTVSTSSNAFDVAGGFGLSGLNGGRVPAEGVYAIGSSSGVYGGNSSTASFTSAGVTGYDQTGEAIGVMGESKAPNGTQSGTAILALSGPEGNSEIPFFPNGVALQALNYNTNGTGAYFQTPSGELTVLDNDSHLLFAESQGIELFGVDSAGNGYFNGDLSSGGNETMAGTLMTSKGTYSRTRGISGSDRIAYGTRSTAPAIDDAGGGQLVNGSAYVHLDAALADVIDPRVEYRVFVTPQGECNDLYVTQKSPAGFLVRELHGGRSSIAFDYRIVAKPFDEDGRRLAVAPPERYHPLLKDRHARPMFSETQMHTHVLGLQALTPQQRFKLMLGPAKYAKALAEFRREQR